MGYKSVLQLLQEHDGDCRKLVITLDEHFNYGSIECFRRLYRQHSAPVHHYVVDMKNTRCLDSSALGLLLDLHRYANKKTTPLIEIINCNAYILKILRICHFDRKFSISPQ